MKEITEATKEKVANIVIIVIAIFVMLMVYIAYVTLTANEDSYVIPTLCIQKPDSDTYIKAHQEVGLYRNDKDQEFFAPFNQYDKYTQENTIYVKAGEEKKVVVHTLADGNWFLSKKFILEKYSSVGDIYYMNAFKAINESVLIYNMTPPTTYLGVLLLKDIEVLKYSKRKDQAILTIKEEAAGHYIYVVKIKNDVIGTLYYSFNVVVTPPDFEGEHALSSYVNTQVSDTKKVKQIVELLPYASLLKEVSYQEIEGKHQIQIQYKPYREVEFDLKYHSTTLFSLIPELDTICYQIGDQVVIRQRN